MLTKRDGRAFHSRPLKVIEPHCVDKSNVSMNFILRINNCAHQASEQNLPNRITANSGVAIPVITSSSETGEPTTSLRIRLEEAAATSSSYFRTCLLKEDVARIATLQSLSRSATDLTAFKAAASVVGWTPGDTRTWELKPALDFFLDAFYTAATTPSYESEKTLNAAWDVFDLTRIDILVGCLSRVPKLNND